MQLNDQQANFILRVLALAGGQWTEPDDTNDMIEAADQIKTRYSELKRTMSFDDASRTARVEFLTSLELTTD